MYKEYKYVIFSLPTQRDIIRINEDDLLEHRDDAIVRSKKWEEDVKRFDEAFDKMEQEWIEEGNKIDEELERREKELAKKQETETEKESEELSETKLEELSEK
jgi:hypothetical protein